MISNSKTLLNQNKYEINVSNQILSWSFKREYPLEVCRPNIDLNSIILAPNELTFIGHQPIAIIKIDMQIKNHG